MKVFIGRLAVLFLCLFLYAHPAQATDMASGSTYTGTVPESTDGSHIVYTYQTFTGTAGQTVLLYINSPIATYLGATKPDGTTWFANNGNRFSGTLPATGTYTVSIRAVHYHETDSYSLAYFRGSSSVSSGSLTSGTSYNGTLAVNGIASFTFTGTASEKVSFTTSASYSTIIQVYKPDGSALNYDVDRLDISLATAGTYTVTVVGYTSANNGAFRLDFVGGGDSVSNGVMQSGYSYNTTLNQNGIVSFQFYGISGQAVSVYTGSAYSTYISMAKPDGTNWTYYSDRFNGSLPATGTYTVFIDGHNYSDNGPLRVDFVTGAEMVSEGWLVNGQTRSNSLLKNGLQSYLFTGTAGTSLTVTSTGSYNKSISIVKPDGTNWTYDTNTLYLPSLGSTGTYRIAVNGSSSASTGAYTVTATYTMPNVTPSTTTLIAPFCVTCMMGLNNEAGDSGEDNDNGTSGAMAGGPPAGTAGGFAGGGASGGGSGGAFAGPLQPSADVINYDAGFKKNVETDYNAGGLVFTRIYRSDSTWTNNTVGALWRHNYARTLTVPGSTASITDGTGATTTYTLSGGVWVPDNAAITATLATVGSTYVYTLPNGTVEKYNSSKLLTRIEYQGGGALNLAYNGSSQLTSVTNENGRSLTMTYDGSGRLATLVTPDGTFSYGYTSGKLTTLTKPDTKTRLYYYEDGTYTNALTGITDEKGNRFSTYAYAGGSGKASSMQFAGSVGNFSVTYNTNDSVVTNPYGKTVTYRFANIQGVRRVIEIDAASSTHTAASSRYFNYDTKARVTGRTDWLNTTTRYTYDSRSNITLTSEAVGTSLQRDTAVTWDSTFNLPNVITESLKTTDYDYDVYARVTSKTVTDLATSASRVWAYTYYTNGTDGSGNTILGRLHEIDGPRTDVGDTTTLAYDGNYDLTTITNPLSQVITVTARDSAGRVTAVSDANSVSTHLAYDTNGRMTSAIQAYGTGLAATTGFTYDYNGNITQVTLPNSVTVNYAYDNTQRLTTITDALGNTINYTLDTWGNPTTVTAKNAVPTTTYTHTQSFDELSRLLTSVGAASQTANYAYDKNSNLATYTDPKTNATGYAYDALTRLSTSTNALSGVTTLGYTGLDDVNSVQDQRSHSTTYTYNAFGDVTGETSPDRGTLSYVVDPAGNVTQRTDGNSVVTNFTYDALNRPLTAAYPADSSLNATLTYDSSSGCGTPYRGHLCTVADATGSTAYQYDSLGRVTQAQETRGGLTFTTSYTYDLAGNILTVTLPSGRVVTYTRNANGQVSAVSAPVNGSSVSLASSVTYLPFGPLQGLTYGNSLTLSATFDTDYNPTNRTISGGIANWTYTTDNNSNVTQAGATTYGYDALDRVNAENAGAATSYTYDATSNRLTKVQGGTTSTTVPSTSNKISAVGGTSYTYDSAGNITAIGTNGYVWSAAGLMKEYKISGVSTATYTYNAYNQRTKKVTGGVTTHYVYGAGGLLYGEYTSAGALVREYIYLNGAPLAQVTAGSPETVAYIHTDHLGTPRFATNTGGSSVWSWNNDAFGVSSVSGSLTVNLRMPGQYYDTESGLFNNWNRYYNPAIGRYTSSDPIGVAGGLNTFGYVGQNPVIEADQSGQGPEAAILCGPYAPACFVALSAVTIGSIYWTASHPTGNAKKGCDVHANSAQSMRPTELYYLINTATGDIEKIGITSFPDERYSDSWLRAQNLYYQTQYQFDSRYPALLAENIELVHYYLGHGRLPKYNLIFQ